MPLFFLLLGILLVVVGINDRVGDLATLVKQDFAPSTSGVPSFVLWVVVIVTLGFIANIKSLKPVSNGLIALVVLAFLVGKSGGSTSVGTTFINEFSSAIKQA